MPAMAKARPRHASVSLAEAPLSPEPSSEHPDEDPEMALVACYLPVLRQAGPSAQDRVGGLKCRDIGRSGRWGGRAGSGPWWRPRRARAWLARGGWARPDPGCGCVGMAQPMGRGLGERAI